MERVYYAVTLEGDHPLVIREFIVHGRGSRLPFGASWTTEGHWLRLPTPENVLEEMARSYPEGTAQPVRWRRVTAAAVEALTTGRRMYRDAWIDDGTTLTHNMVKARALHRTFLRAQRDKAFAALDAAYLRADEDGNGAAKSEIRAQKQRLRDLPNDPALEAATSVDELRALWPVTLLSRD